MSSDGKVETLKALAEEFRDLASIQRNLDRDLEKEWHTGSCHNPYRLIEGNAFSKLRDVFNKYEAFCKAAAQQFTLEHDPGVFPEKSFTITSTFPRKVRLEVISKLAQNILPGLRNSLRDFLKLAMFHPLDERVVTFDYPKGVQLISRINEYASAMVSEILVVEEALQYSAVDYLKLPEFLIDELAGKSDEEPLEQLAYTPWEVLGKYVDEIMHDVKTIFLDAEPWESRSQNFFAKELSPAITWLEEMITLRDKVDQAAFALGRPHCDVYIRQWRNRDYCYTYAIGDFAEIGPDSPERPVVDTLISVLKFYQALAIKICGRGKKKSDALSIQKMSTARLEALMRHIGDYRKQGTVANNCLKLSKHGRQGPRELWTSAKLKPGRNGLFSVSENRLRGGLQILVAHQKDLLNSDDAEARKSAEYALEWIKGWKVAYNMVVDRYLKTYKQVYRDQFASIDDASYFGQPFEYETSS